MIELKKMIAIEVKLDAIDEYKTPIFLSLFLLNIRDSKV